MKVNEQRLREDQRQKEEQIKGIDIEIMKINSDYESRIQGLSLDIDRKDTDILILQNELQESRANLKKCNSSNDTLKKENNELIRVRNELQGKLTECNQRYNENQKTIQKLQKQKEYTESRISSQSSGEMDLLESQSLLKDQIKRLESQISELNREQEQLKTLKSGLETQLQTCNSSNATLQRENEKLEGRLQASEFSLKTEREDSLRLLERIKELDLARKDAEEVNKSIENDRIELQKGITSKHVEIQRLERELDSLNRKLTELENNPAADFDAYNQGMEEAKQNYIQQIQELQSRISGFDTEKKRMEIQLEECTKVRLELSSKINDLEKLVENLKLENEKLKVENANLVKQVKDREVGSVKLNEKLKVENQKLIKEREMYSSQFQQTQKLQADNTRYEEIVKSLQEKLQSEILKNRGEKSVIENEYRQSLETIEELNKQLENCKKLLSENSFKLLQSQQIQAFKDSQASQASQDKIKELENINNLLREEITKISEQLRLKNSEISREGSSRILEIKNEEERLTGILKRLNTEIGFSEHQLRQLQENISKKKDISVVSSFNTSINDEEYDRIQRIIKNVERVTKKCDKLSVSKMSK
jgi:chromosome segregation ATPase